MFIGLLRHIFQQFHNANDLMQNHKKQYRYKYRYHHAHNSKLAKLTLNLNDKTIYEDEKT